MNAATRHASRPAGANVSSTSAQRFAAKVRDRRRRRWLTGALVVVLLLGTGWLAVLSPWATVETIEIRRTVPAAVMEVAPQRLSDADLMAQAEEEIGHPMLMARAVAVRDRLQRLKLVSSATVSRKWPSTLVLTVTERAPVAAVPASAQSGRTTAKGAKPNSASTSLVLVDIDGVQLGRVTAVPAGLPRLDVDLESAGSASLQACLAMLARLPEEVEGRVASIGADSPDGITLKLADGSTVKWGDAAQTPRKAEVLLALLKQKAVAYDVRSPETPAIRKG